MFLKSSLTVQLFNSETALPLIREVPTVPGRKYIKSIVESGSTFKIPKIRKNSGSSQGSNEQEKRPDSEEVQKFGRYEAKKKLLSATSYKMMLPQLMLIKKEIGKLDV